MNSDRRFQLIENRLICFLIMPHQSLPGLHLPAGFQPRRDRAREGDGFMTHGLDDIFAGFQEQEARYLERGWLETEPAGKMSERKRLVKERQLHLSTNDRVPHSLE